MTQRRRIWPCVVVGNTTSCDWIRASSSRIGARRVSETGALLPHLEALPQHEGEEAHEDVGLNAILALMPDRAHVQLILLDTESGFGLGELDVGLPELLIAPVGDVRAQQTGYAVVDLATMGVGHYSDSRGAKRGVIVGLLAAAASGLLHLLSLGFNGTPLTSVAILLLGRAVLGGAESFIITAAVSWGLALVDPRSTGKVIAWVGSAMFAAFAIGAPAGSALYAAYGFTAIAFATAVAPLGALLLVAPLPAVAPVSAHPLFVRQSGSVPYGYRASARHSAAWASAR